MTKTLEFGDISTDLFLKNISNLPGINFSLAMIDIEYVGYPNNKQIVSSAQNQFLIFCKKITNEISAMCSKIRPYQPAFDYEELVTVKKLINSLDSSSSKLLQITIDKIDEMMIFVLSIEKIATKINFSNEDQEKIRQEAIIARHRLKL
jgi:hypothetical protein